MGWVLAAIAIFIVIGLLIVMPSPSEWRRHAQRKKRLPARKANKLADPTHWWAFTAAPHATTGHDGDVGGDSGDGGSGDC